MVEGLRKKLIDISMYFAAELFEDFESLQIVAIATSYFAS
jgi:hypothetical protein